MRTYAVILFITIVMVFTCLGDGIPLQPKFIDAIHQVETGGRLGAIVGDNGKALGPFQIHHNYWSDAHVLGEYKQCADYQYSINVMTAYLNRYAGMAVRNQDFERLARIHNGGPRGDKTDATLPYWHRVKKELDKSIKP